MLFLGKPSAYGSARLGHIPSLPWESQLPLKPYLSLQPLDFEGNCDSFDSLLDFCLVSLFSSVICSANVGYSPTPRQHFWKIVGSKNFLVRPRLVIKNLTSRNTTWIRFGRIASLSAFVLFADGCVVRIIFQSFLDFRFSEFFLFPEWRTAFTNFS